MQEFETQVCQILLVEDNPGDVMLIQEAFREGEVRSNLTVVSDGDEAVRYLRRDNGYARSSQPDLILLDLNLHRKDGREVLRIVKSDHDLCVIPIIVLTTSSDPRDVLETYRLHANCFLTKPADLEEYFALVHAVENFWMKLALLPGAGQKRPG